MTTIQFGTGNPPKHSAVWDTEKKQLRITDADGSHDVGRGLGGRITAGGKVSKGQLVGFSRARYRASNTAVSSSDATSVTVTKPTGTINDDLLIAVFGALDDSTANTLSAPSGWTELLAKGTVAQDNQWKVFYKVASAEGTDYTFTASVTTRLAAIVAAFSGVDTSSPFDDSDGVATSSGTSHATPAIDTTVVNTLLVAIMGVDAAASTFTPPTGFTEIADAVSTGADNDVTVEMSWKLQAATGAVSAQTGTSSQTGFGAAFLLALKPAWKPAVNTAGLYWAARGIAAANAESGDECGLMDAGIVRGSSLVPGDPVYLSDVPGGITTTRPTVGAGTLVQPVGYALSATEALVQVRPFREVDIELQAIKYTGAEGDGMDTTALDSSAIVFGYILNAQNEHIVFTGTLPEGFVKLVRSTIAVSQDASTPGTHTISVASVLPGVQHDLVTADTSESAKTLAANAASDPIYEYDASAAFDANDIVQPGARLFVDILKDDAGTVATEIYGVKLVALVC